MLTENTLYQNIRQVILNAKAKISYTVNFTMVETYWLVGKYIIEEEQDGKHRDEYGKQQMKLLAEKLTEEFGNSYDRSNLLRMKNFYLAFPIWNALRSELSWTHYRSLLRVENGQARLFYMQEAIANNYLLLNTGFTCLPKKN